MERQDKSFWPKQIKEIKEYYKDKYWIELIIKQKI